MKQSKKPKIDDVGSLGNSKVSNSKLLTEIVVSGFNVFALNGQIVEESDKGIVFRYKKDGTRTIVREFFAFSSIVAIHKQSNNALLWVKTNRALFVDQGGKFKLLDNGMVSLVTTMGQELILNPSNNCGMEVSTKMFESEEFSSTGKIKESKHVPESSSDDEEEEEIKPKKKISKADKKALLKKKKKHK